MAQQPGTSCMYYWSGFCFHIGSKLKSLMFLNPNQAKLLEKFGLIWIHRRFFDSTANVTFLYVLLVK